MLRRDVYHWIKTFFTNVLTVREGLGRIFIVYWILRNMTTGDKEKAEILSTFLTSVIAGPVILRVLLPQPEILGWEAE